MPEVFIEKPSKVLNLIYLLFGYVLGSYFVLPLSLTFEGKLTSVVVLSSIIGTFIFYIRPVERIMKVAMVLSRRDKVPILISESPGIRSYFERSKQDLSNPKASTELDSELERERRRVRIIYRKSEVLNSPLLAEERARVVGASFFTISILLSAPLLNALGLQIPFVYILAAAVLMSLVALYEAYSTARKLVWVVWYYVSARFSIVSKELTEALSIRDWKMAEQVLQKQFAAGSILFTSPGYCLHCKMIVKNAYYCPTCGDILLRRCRTCNAPLVNEEDKFEPPIYCPNCREIVQPKVHD